MKLTTLSLCGEFFKHFLDILFLQMREASAVLILANRHCTNPDAEDAANIMR
jgi:hypothetical protein